MLAAQIAFVREIPYYEERSVNAQRLLNPQNANVLVSSLPPFSHKGQPTTSRLFPAHVQASAEKFYPEPDNLRVQATARFTFLVVFRCNRPKPPQARSCHTLHIFSGTAQHFLCHGQSYDCVPEAVVLNRLICVPLKRLIHVRLEA